MCSQILDLLQCLSESDSLASKLDELQMFHWYISTADTYHPNATLNVHYIYNAVVHMMYIVCDTDTLVNDHRI